MSLWLFINDMTETSTMPKSNSLKPLGGIATSAMDHGVLFLTDKFILQFIKETKDTQKAHTQYHKFNLR